MKELIENLPMSLKDLCQAHEDAVTTKTEVTQHVKETTDKLKQIIGRLIQPETAANSAASPTAGGAADSNQENNTGRVLIIFFQRIWRD